METRIDNSWHLKKEFNIGHFLTTILLFMSLAGYGIKVDQRITATEIRMESLQETIRVEREITREANKDIIQEIRLLRAEMALINSSLAEQRNR